MEGTVACQGIFFDLKLRGFWRGTAIPLPAHTHRPKSLVGSKFIVDSLGPKRFRTHQVLRPLPFRAIGIARHAIPKKNTLENNAPSGVFEKGHTETVKTLAVGTLTFPPGSMPCAALLHRRCHWRWNSAFRVCSVVSLT